MRQRLSGLIRAPLLYSALLLMTILAAPGCGGGAGLNPNISLTSVPPAQASSKFLYVTGTIPGNKT